MLGTLGGLAGLLAGAWLVRVLPDLLPGGLPRTDNIDLDWIVVAGAMAAALVTSTLFGLLPALQASRADAALAMKAAGERGSSGRSRGGSVLVVLEVALTLVLLASAGLLTRSFAHLQRVDSGFRPEHVLVAPLLLPPSRYPDAAHQIEIYDRLLESLSGRPEISAVGLGFPGPLKGNNASGTMTIEGWPASRKDQPTTQIAAVSGGFFKAMGIPLTAGRTFTNLDRDKAPGVAILNSAIAKRYWPGENVLGKRIKFDDDQKSPWSTVVGVVADTRQLGLGEDLPPIAYVPYQQFPLPFTNVAVRASAPDATVTALLRTSLSTLDRDLPLPTSRHFKRCSIDRCNPARFQAMFVGLFAVVALVLAAVGIYGLVSFTVGQRTREFGIRVALGARPSQIVWPVLRQGGALAIAGIALGLVGALMVTRLLSSLLFDVNAADPITFSTVALVLLGVALFAAYIPSLRAGRGRSAHRTSRVGRRSLTLQLEEHELRRRPRSNDDEALAIGRPGERRHNAVVKFVNA